MNDCKELWKVHSAKRGEDERNVTQYLERIWQEYFADIPRVNAVQIAYCSPWKMRLGLIRLSLDNATTFIGINSLLRLVQVPECVLITTIAHELVHYAHGFGSPLPRLYPHPHAHDIVEQELEQRALGELLRYSNTWIDDEWHSFYATQRASRKRRRLS
jgi:hypothetical protein